MHEQRQNAEIAHKKLEEKVIFIFKNVQYDKLF